MATNGSGVEQDPVDGATDTAIGATGVGAGTDAPAASGESGGTHPPFTQIQVATGFTVTQVPGGTSTVPLGAVGSEGGAGVGLARAAIANG